MPIRFEENEDSLVLYFVESIFADHIGHDIGRLGKPLEQFATIVVDFQYAEALDSAMIGRIVLLNRMVQSHKINLRVRNVGLGIRELFRITRLSSPWSPDASEDD